MSVKEDIIIASSNKNKNEIKNSTKVIQYNPDNFENKKGDYDIEKSAVRSQQIKENNSEKVRNPTEDEVKKKRLIRRILIGAFISIIIIVVIVLSIYFSNRNKKKGDKVISTDEVTENELIKRDKEDDEEESKNNNNEKNIPIKKQENEVLTKEEAMKAVLIFPQKKIV